MQDQTQRETSLSKRLFGTLYVVVARTSTALTSYIESLLVASVQTYLLAGVESLLGGTILLLIWLVGRFHRKISARRVVALLGRLRRSISAERTRALEFIGIVVGISALTLANKEMALLALAAKFPSGSLSACLALGTLTLSTIQGIRAGQTWRALGTSAVALVGITLVTGTVSMSGLGLPLSGALFAILSAISRTLTIPLSRRAIDRRQGEAVNALSTLLSAAMLLGWAAVFSHGNLSLPRDLILTICLLGVTSNVLPQVFDLLARQRISDRNFSIAYSSGLIVSTILSVLGHQHLTFLQIIGIVLILIAVLASQLTRRQRA
jgi:drug/metabolite transporter (DMT)-like permease